MIVTVLTLIGVLLAGLVVHEAAHALALHKLGIPVSRAGVGLPLPPMFTLRVRGVSYTLSPWLAGAYVEADRRYEDQIEALPYRQHAWFLNAGIVANLLLGFVAVAAAAVMQGRPLLAAVSGTAAVAAWFGRRLVAAYVLPALSVPAFAAIAVPLARSWGNGETGAGFVGMVKMVPSGAVESVLFLGVVSLALAWLNALPLYGLDNGRVVDLVLRRRIGPGALLAYRVTGVTLVLGMIALSIGSDLWAAASAALGGE